MTTTASGYASSMSPCIESVGWGKIKVEQYAPPFKDCIVYSWKAEEWDWSVYGTNHDGGIKVEEIKRFFTGTKDANAVILSSGMLMKIKTNKDTLLFLQQLAQERGIRYFIGETTEAVKKI